MQSPREQRGWGAPIFNRRRTRLAKRRFPRRPKRRTSKRRVVRVLDDKRCVPALEHEFLQEREQYTIHRLRGCRRRCTLDSAWRREATSRVLVCVPARRHLLPAPFHDRRQRNARLDRRVLSAESIRIRIHEDLRVLWKRLHCLHTTDRLSLCLHDVTERLHALVNDFRARAVLGSNMHEGHR